MTVFPPPNRSGVRYAPQTRDEHQDGSSGMPASSRNLTRRQENVMIGNLVQNQFHTARDWPFGSAVSLILMAIVMVLLLAIIRRDKEGLL